MHLASKAAAQGAANYARKQAVTTAGKRLAQGTAAHNAAVRSMVASYEARGIRAVANRACFEKAKLGFCRVPDIIVYDRRGNVSGLIEVKTGSSRYWGTMQNRRDDIIRNKLGIRTTLTRF